MLTAGRWVCVALIQAERLYLRGEACSTSLHDFSDTLQFHEFNANKNASAAGAIYRRCPHAPQVGSPLYSGFVTVNHLSLTQLNDVNTLLHVCHATASTITLMNYHSIKM
jgi:hypothetical protein